MTTKTVPHTSKLNTITKEEAVTKGKEVATLMEQEKKSGTSESTKKEENSTPVPEPMKGLQTPEESPVNE